MSGKEFFSLAENENILMHFVNTIDRLPNEKRDEVIKQMFEMTSSLFAGKILEKNINALDKLLEEMNIPLNQRPNLDEKKSYLKALNKLNEVSVKTREQDIQDLCTVIDLLPVESYQSLLKNLVEASGDSNLMKEIAHQAMLDIKLLALQRGLNKNMTVKEALSQLAVIKEKSTEEWKKEIENLPNIFQGEKLTEIKKTTDLELEELQMEEEQAALLKTITDSTGKIEELEEGMSEAEIKATSQIAKFFHEYGDHGKSNEK